MKRWLGRKQNRTRVGVGWICGMGGRWCGGDSANGVGGSVGLSSDRGEWRY